MDLPDSGLPPGFVPAGPATPGAETSYTGAGVPLPPSTLGSYHSRLPSYGGSARDGETPVVIPPPSGRSGREETDDSSSDADTLSTPPARRYRVPSSGGYSAAGVALPSGSVGGTPYSYGRSVGSEGMYVSAGVTPAALGRAKSFSTDRGTSVRG